MIWYDEPEGPFPAPTGFNQNTTQFTLPLILISPLAKGNAYNEHPDLHPLFRPEDAGGTL